MASRSKKLGIVLSIALISVVFGALLEPSYASCTDNPLLDCRKTCRADEIKDADDCMSLSTVREGFGSGLTCSDLEKVYNSGCNSVSGTHECYSGDGYTYDCYYPEEAPSPSVFGSKIIVCSCVSAETGSEASSPSDVIGDLGLDQISLSGIFAGQLSISQLVQFVILLVLSVLMLVLLFIIIKSGIVYAGSGDDEQKKKGAIKGITNALVGAAIVFGSYVILSFFFSFFGLSPFKKIVPIEDCSGLTGEARERCEELINED